MKDGGLVRNPDYEFKPGDLVNHVIYGSGIIYRIYTATLNTFGFMQEKRASVYFQGKSSPADVDLKDLRIMSDD